MNAETWERAQVLYHAALALPAEQRPAFLAEACAADTSLHKEVESLLSYHGRSDELLDRPAWDHLPPPNSADPLHPGQVVSHYKLIDILGKGGMGVVWRASDPLLKRQVAIKCLPASDAADQDRRMRFLQEARSAGALNHPNIVTIHDIFHDEGATFLVMELVDGKPLDQIIAAGVSRKNALSYAIQIAEALEATHRIGIIHRDLKPANVMVTATGRVKVLDFGLAKNISLPSPADPAQSKPPTARGIIAGTVGYMSPEQAEGREVDTRSDIFSFGTLLYELLSGKPAFPASSAALTLAAILQDHPPPIAAIPPDLAKTLDRCLRKDPERRMQHIGDVKLALEEVRDQPAPAPPPARAYQWHWPLTTALLLAVAAFILAWNYPRPADPPLTSQPLTAFPGSETGPALSPDGNQVAFSWNGTNQDNADIYVKLVAGGPPLRLTTDPGRDHAPAFSPDGSQIAFLRTSGARDVRTSILLVPALGGPEREFATLVSRLDRDTGLAWTPDGESIAFADQTSPTDPRFSVFRVSLQTRERHRLTTPLPGTIGDLNFAFSPNARQIAVARHGTFSNADLYVLNPGDESSARRIATSHASIGSLTFTPNAKEIVYSSDGTLWRCSLAGSPSLPLALAGVEGAAEAPFLSRSGRLAYSRTAFDNNLWTQHLDSGSSTHPIARSTLIDNFPHIAPDGTRIAFASTRTGKLEIWTASIDGADAMQVSFLRAAAHSPRWSPDGKVIAFAALVDGNRDIYRLDAAGGNLRRLTTEPSEDGRPSWSRDGRYLYFYSNRSGPQELWKMPANGGTPAQVTTGGGHSAEESLDGRYLIYSRSPVPARGLFLLPLSGGAPRQILPDALSGWWAVTQRGIYFASASRAPAELAPPIPILLHDLRTGTTSRVAEIRKPINTGAAGLTASLDGKRLVWAQTDHDDSDLLLIENFH
ncbi:MAG: serine/threonine-protein kinase [Bryobacterales bacterium]|nr:serine/threonine-protein kinase [Bryobacterales bacterium]